MYHRTSALKYIILMPNGIVFKEVLYAQMGPMPAHLSRYPTLHAMYCSVVQLPYVALCGFVKYSYMISMHYKSHPICI